MTPKEKAEQLVEKMIIYHSPDDKDYEAAKDCALIAVYEIIELHKGMFMAERENQNESYWQEVKKEIEKL